MFVTPPFRRAQAVAAPFHNDQVRGPRVNTRRARTSRPDGHGLLGGERFHRRPGPPGTAPSRATKLTNTSRSDRPQPRVARTRSVASWLTVPAHGSSRRRRRSSPVLSCSESPAGGTPGRSASDSRPGVTDVPLDTSTATLVRPPMRSRLMAPSRRQFTSWRESYQQFCGLGDGIETSSRIRLPVVMAAGGGFLVGTWLYLFL